MKTSKPPSFAAWKMSSIFSTVLFSLTLSRTDDRAAPFSLSTSIDEDYRCIIPVDSHDALLVLWLRAGRSAVPAPPRRAEQILMRSPGPAMSAVPGWREATRVRHSRGRGMADAPLALVEESLSDFRPPDGGSVKLSPPTRTIWTLEFGLNQSLMNASRSALIVSACVVGMPCGKPL